jgi:peptidoglycan hydrolase CwlO-like protein
MKTEQQNILKELQKIKDHLESVVQSQKDLKKDMNMIFSDITHFENLVLKILDHQSQTNISKEIHH